MKLNENNATLSEPKPEAKTEDIRQAADTLRRWASDRQANSGRWTAQEQKAVECAVRLEDAIRPSILRKPDAPADNAQAVPQKSPLPCPFCGSVRVFQSTVAQTNGNTMFLFCGNCQAQGPWTKSTEDDREKKWNQRVAPSVVAGVGEHASGVSLAEEALEEAFREADQLRDGASSDEEIAREAEQLFLRNHRVLGGVRFEPGQLAEAFLTAIRKAKSLSEPKESEEEKEDL